VTAIEIINCLGLIPHREGGWYRETFRDATDDSGRAYCTVIYYLLAQGEVSVWHRVDATEIWLWHAGDPLSLTTRDEAGEVTVVLGPQLAAGQRPHAVVPAHIWQTAVSRGAWTLVSCVVAPGFAWKGLEMETQARGR
jgi:predicted cupin superfamily sugar epimerase